MKIFLLRFDEPNEGRLVLEDNGSTTVALKFSLDDACYECACAEHTRLIAITRFLNNGLITGELS